LRWAPLAGRDRVPSLLDSDGYFFNDPDLLVQAKLPEVDVELRAQVDRAKAQGIRLSHLDSHMIALASRPDFFQEYAHLGRDYGLPIRLARDGPYSPPGASALAASDFSPSQPLLDAVITLDPGVPERDW